MAGRLVLFFVPVTTEDPQKHYLGWSEVFSLFDRNKLLLFDRNEFHRDFLVIRDVSSPRRNKGHAPTARDKPSGTRGEDNRLPRRMGCSSERMTVRLTSLADSRPSCLADIRPSCSTSRVFTATWKLRTRWLRAHARHWLLLILQDRHACGNLRAVVTFAGHLPKLFCWTEPVRLVHLLTTKLVLFLLSWTEGRQER